MLAAKNQYSVCTDAGKENKMLDDWRANRSLITHETLETRNDLNTLTMCNCLHWTTHKWDKEAYDGEVYGDSRGIANMWDYMMGCVAELNRRGEYLTKEYKEADAENEKFLVTAKDDWNTLNYLHSPEMMSAAQAADYHARQALQDQVLRVSPVLNEIDELDNDEGGEFGPTPPGGTNFDDWVAQQISLTPQHSEPPPPPGAPPAEQAPLESESSSVAAP